MNGDFEVHPVGTADKLKKMEGVEMSDLVKRLRDAVFDVGEVVFKEKLKDLNTAADLAADRIEQLERELAECRADRDKWSGQFQEILSAGYEMKDQLAAEKSLADRLYEEGVTSSRWDLPCYVAFRKARGL